LSLLPASVTAGASDDGRIGAADAVAVADSEASGAAGVVPVEGRGRAAGCAALFFGCTDGDCGDVRRAKSLPMFRAASQPDKSNSPTLTVCLITTLIVILAQYVSRALEMPCGLIAARPRPNGHNVHLRQ
jgi:hypothetical protein